MNKLKNWKKKFRQSTVSSKHVSNMGGVIQVDGVERFVFFSVPIRGGQAREGGPFPFEIACVVGGDKPQDLKRSMAMIFREKFLNDFEAAKALFSRAHPDVKLKIEDVIPRMDNSGQLASDTPRIRLHHE